MNNVEPFPAKLKEVCGTEFLARRFLPTPGFVCEYFLGCEDCLSLRECGFERVSIMLSRRVGKMPLLDISDVEAAKLSCKDSDGCIWEDGIGEGITYSKDSSNVAGFCGDYYISVTAPIEYWGKPGDGPPAEVLGMFKSPATANLIAVMRGLTAHIPMMAIKKT